MRALFAAWADAGIVDLLLTWDGSFVPRFVRGKPDVLSNHAWGTAFDVNFPWNRLGTVPALRGEQGVGAGAGADRRRARVLLGRPFLALRRDAFRSGQRLVVAIRAGERTTVRGST